MAMLPCFGITTHLVATFSRKPVWKERLVVLALCGVGVVGFCVWGYHMFATGMNPYAPLVFSVLASSLGHSRRALAGQLARHALGRANSTHHRRCCLPLALFRSSSRAVSPGIFLARHDLAQAAVSEDFVIGHFHLVMGVAATFAILGALFFWFPKMFGCRLNETLGKDPFLDDLCRCVCDFHAHALVGTADAIAHAAGRAAHRAGVGRLLVSHVCHRCHDLPRSPPKSSSCSISSARCSCATAKKAEANNPWRATTLEWSVASPAPAE